jgi:hypothetical protein
MPTSKKRKTRKSKAREGALDLSQLRFTAKGLMALEQIRENYAASSGGVQSSSGAISGARRPLPTDDGTGPMARSGSGI